MRTFCRAVTAIYALLSVQHVFALDVRGPDKEDGVEKNERIGSSILVTELTVPDEDISNFVRDLKELRIAKEEEDGYLFWDSFQVKESETAKVVSGNTDKTVDQHRNRWIIVNEVKAAPDSLSDGNKGKNFDKYVTQRSDKYVTQRSSGIVTSGKAEVKQKNVAAAGSVCQLMFITLKKTGTEKVFLETVNLVGKQSREERGILRWVVVKLEEVVKIPEGAEPTVTTTPNLEEQYMLVEVYHSQEAVEKHGTQTYVKVDWRDLKKRAEIDQRKIIGKKYEPSVSSSAVLEVDQTISRMNVRMEEKMTSLEDELRIHMSSIKWYMTVGVVASIMAVLVVSVRLLL